MNQEVSVAATSPSRNWAGAWGDRRKRRWMLVTATLACLFLWLIFTAPLSKSLQPIAAPSLTLVSAEGEPIARRGAIVAEPIELTDLPPHVWQAFVAVEDRRFYGHPGIDPIGITRALINNIRAGKVQEGGSTITQQLAKLAFLDSRRSPDRKLQEMLIAVWMEFWLSKNDILGRYLSSAYFGDNVYGLRAAARHYFGVEPENLSVSEAAMLAGSVKAPSKLNPHVDLAAARERARIVINAMVDVNVLDQAEAGRLPPATPERRKDETLPTGTYFADWVFAEARKRTEERRGSQKVRTTLEAPLQRLAARAIGRARIGDAQIGLVALRPDGRVVAMVGGRSYSESPYNRVTQAVRQPGSTFKLFVYFAALRAGMTPETLIEDAPISIDDWKPQNSDGKYRGLITLRQAFAVSSNVAAVRLSEKVGRGDVISAARALGVRSELKPNPSIALGTSGLTLLELTAAYAAVASGTYPVTPHGLPRAKQGWLERWFSKPKRLEKDLHLGLLDLLHSAVDRGTGQAARLSRATFGKTGTTQDNRDALFIGFSQDLITGVWIGNDDNRPLTSGVSGGTTAARIWRAFMQEAISRGLAGKNNGRWANPSPVPAAAAGGADGDRSRKKPKPQKTRREKDEEEAREEQAEREEEAREERAERQEERQEDEWDD